MDVTVATGALGTADTTWLIMELAAELAAADVATAEAGIVATIELTIETIGANWLATAVLDAAGKAPFDELAAGHPPKRPIPKISQTTELTMEVTVATGALGSADATWLTIELATNVAAGDEATAEAGTVATIELTTETMGATTTGVALLALIVGRAAEDATGVAQPPRRPIPRMLQTTEFTTEVTVATGAFGTAEATCSTIELAAEEAAAEEAMAEAGREMTIELTAETMGARLAGTDAALEATIGADSVLETIGVAAFEELEVAQPPSNPIPRISQTIELTTEVTVAAGALGIAEEI
ncbi:hypothetical protein LTS18_012545 [Coniosporium uncinatum]|uniref:Uncharacterized protein n=1 Tax=Coniosporium uncinatum TaxID=93489 RepID=A0ACC3CXV9_9PEZI|nr:hypothetical protein LTS18_012545 [Coniosporium uncinatum]